MQVSMEEKTQFSEIWGDALRMYKGETGRDLLKEASYSLRTPDDLLAHLEAEESKFHSFLEKKKRLWSALKASMEPVKFLGDTAQAALQGTPFASAGAIFTATSYLIKSAKGVSDAYGCITELLESLADFSDRLDEYAKDVIDTKLRKKITLILVTLLEIIAKSERAIARGRVKEFAKHAFLGKDDGVADAMSRLQVLTESEVRYVAAKTYSTTQKLDKDVNRISSSLIESRKEKLEETERRTVEDALFSDAVHKIAEIQARNTNERQKGSGDWLKNEKLYVSWLKSEEPVLWILGGPGSGKSFLASAIISQLLETQTQVQGSMRVSVGYFYIQEDDSQLRSLNTILKSVAYQLQDKDAVYAKYLAKATSSPQKTITAANTWKSLFLDYFGSAQYGEKQAFVVLDGIDEAPRKERETLFRLLKDLEDSFKGSAPPRIQVILIGRPDLRDDTVFIWDRPIIYIEVSAQKTKDDILSYIKSSVGRVRALKQARDSLESRLKLRKEIINKLSEGANGMFLWVNFMLDQIYDLSRPSDISEALNNAPRRLSEMIRHVFERLDEDLRGFRKDDIREILAWVTCAQIPLDLAELKAVLRLRPPLGEGVPDLEERLRGQFASFFILKRRDGLTTETLLERAAHAARTLEIAGSEREAGCDDSSEDSGGEGSDDDSGSLVEYSDKELPQEIQSSDPYASDFYTTVIQFSHASIRDYLVRESNPAKREFPANLQISINTVEAEKHIAITCLQVLTEELKLPRSDDTDSDESNDGTDSESDEDNGNDDTSGETNGSVELVPVYNLMDYAAENFIKHLEHTQKSSLTIEDEQTITRSLLRLFRESVAAINWIEGASDLAVLATEWLVGAKYAEFVRGWLLNQILNIDSYLEKEVEQMKKLAESDQELLRFLALEISKKWLTDEDKDTYVDGYVSFLNMYVPKGDDENGKASIKAVASDSVKGISEARLLKLAEFGGLEKTSHWYSHLAEAFRTANHIDAAIKSFETAIKLDDTNWIAMGRLSYTYETLELYELAVEWARKAVEHCPTVGHKKDRSFYWQTIAFCLLDLGDLEGAKAAAKEACDLQPESGDALSAYVMVLDADEDHSELVKYCEGLQSRVSESTDESLLTMALLANDFLLEVLGAAAREVGKLNFVIQAQETAIEAAQRGEDLEEAANQQRLLAELYFTHVKDQKKAVELWELAMKNKDSSAETLESASGNLSMVYYAEATAAEKAGKSPRQWVTKLEKLAKYDRDTHTSSNSGASMMLGLWHREHGNIVESRNCCRARVLEALDMLNDTDPYNDREAWLTLSETLIKAGDRVNATAADAVVAQELTRLRSAIARRKSRTEDRSAVADTTATSRDDPFSANVLVPAAAALDINQEADSPSHKSAQVIPSDAPGVDISYTTTTGAETVTRPEITTSDWFCDGQCRRRADEWQELHVCEICLRGVCFCEKCIVLLKEDKLPFRVCSSEHTFFQEYPIKEGWGNGREGMILIDGQEVGLEEWLMRLRGEWAVQ